MRLRILASAAVAALTYFAIEYRAELPALPDPTALIINMRNQVTPFRFTLDTDPESPSCDAPIMLKVHVIDTAGQPADGLLVEADAAMSGMDHRAQHLSLHGKGHGNYEGRVGLETAGSWNVDLSTTKDLMRSWQRFIIEVDGAQAPLGPRNPNEDNSAS